MKFRLAKEVSCTVCAAGPQSQPSRSQRVRPLRDYGLQQRTQLLHERVKNFQGEVAVCAGAVAEPDLQQRDTDQIHPVPDSAPRGESLPLPSSGWQHLPHHLRAEALWLAIREEARYDAEAEPALASYVHTTILTHASLAKSMAFMLANKLSSRTLLGTQLMRLILAAYEDDPGIMDACRADVQAVRDRDAACDKFLHCILYYKGFQAVQCHRIAHWLWQHGRQTLAVAIQSRVSEVMQVDIHPAAALGKGILIDHATGVVIGETAVVGDNVSMLHHVTLGGSGTGKGRRHPTVGHGVLIGAGTCVLGPISIGAGTKIGAGSVVVGDLPCHCVAVGVPARIIKKDCEHEPCSDMDLVADFVFDYQI